jgi:DNA-binding XRE family transcriptional regulator
VAAHIEEKGGIPGVDIVEKLAAALNLLPCFLAYGIDAPVAEGYTPGSERVGDRLRQAREARGLSKNALGKSSGTTGQTVRNIETGQTLPSVATAEQLAKALGVSPCWLAYGQGEGPQGVRASEADADKETPS